MAYKVFLRTDSAALTATLVRTFEDQSLTLVVPELDWRSRSAVAQWLTKVAPSVIVDARMLSLDPDAGEDAALDVMVDFARERNVPLLYLSSYRVFGELASVEGFLESDEPKPADAVGRRFLQNESAVSSLEKHMILRRSWMLNGDGETLLGTLVPLLLEDKLFYVSDHQYGCPIKISFLARCILTISEQIMCGACNWGVFHLRSSDKCSEAEICDALRRLLAQESDRAVPMPPVAGMGDDRRLFVGNGFLGGRRCTYNFGIQLPSWRSSLKSLLSSYLAQSGQSK